MKIIEVTDEAGALVAPDWLARAERVHRQLRPHLPANYAEKMGRVIAGGARMALATRNGAVLGVAVYRCQENTADGVKLYIDDLVADEEHRSAGVGHALLKHVAGVARRRGCDCIGLDSGTHRTRAHRFYFREGFVITSFNFKKILL